MVPNSELNALSPSRKSNTAPDVASLIRATLAWIRHVSKTNSSPVIPGDEIQQKKSPAVLGWALVKCCCPPVQARSRFLFDFPRRVMRDVHREIAARASRRRHGYAGKWLTPGNPLIFPGTAGDDVGATIHFRLRLIEVARIEGRENLVTVAVGQHAGAVNVFLVAGRHVQRRAMSRHLVQHLLSLHVLGSPDRLQRGGRT